MSKFVRIRGGNTVINLDNVAHINLQAYDASKKPCVEVHFNLVVLVELSANGQVFEEAQLWWMRFYDEDADALRRWVEQNVETLQ